METSLYFNPDRCALLPIDHRVGMIQWTAATSSLRAVTA